MPKKRVFLFWRVSPSPEGPGRIQNGGFVSSWTGLNATKLELWVWNLLLAWFLHDYAWFLMGSSTNTVKNRKTWFAHKFLDLVGLWALNFPSTVWRLRPLAEHGPVGKLGLVAKLGPATKHGSTWLTVAKQLPCQLRDKGDMAPQRGSRPGHTTSPVINFQTKSKPTWFSSNR